MLAVLIQKDELEPYHVQIIRWHWTSSRVVVLPSDYKLMELEVAQCKDQSLPTVLLMIVLSHHCCCGSLPVDRGTLDREVVPGKGCIPG